jgi:XamI restriction endonuclease
LDRFDLALCRWNFIPPVTRPSSRNLLRGRLRSFKDEMFQTGQPKVKMINADKPRLWKTDITKSVRLYNEWFLRFAPRAYKESRKGSISQVQRAFTLTDNFRTLDQETLVSDPVIISTLRMSTSPPLARDRLAGLSGVSKNLLASLERGVLPPNLPDAEARVQLSRVCAVINVLLDRELFTWLARRGGPDKDDTEVAVSVVADRLSGAIADPVIRNAQEQHQLKKIGRYLSGLGYREVSPSTVKNPLDLKPGTFTFRLNLKVGTDDRVKLPIDAVIKPASATADALPVLIEAKSAGDYTNTNKRRKEEATKGRQLREKYGERARLLLFLRGYFDAGYLGYEAAEGLDWVWEHRIEDLRQAGI